MVLQSLPDAAPHRPPHLQDNVSAEKSEKQLQSITSSFESLSADQQRLEDDSKVAGDRYNAALSGIASNEDGNADTIGNQLIGESFFRPKWHGNINCYILIKLEFKS